MGTRRFHFKFQFRCDTQELNSAATQHLERSLLLESVQETNSQNQSEYSQGRLNTCAMPERAQDYFGCDLRLTTKGKCFFTGCNHYSKLEMIL